MVIKGIGEKITFYNQNKIEEEKNLNLKKESKKTENSFSKGDKIQLSTKGKLLNEIISTVKQDDNTLRSEKIKELKESIDNGTYKIDSQKIAKKIIETEIDIFL